MRLSKDSLDLLLWAVAAVTVTCTSPYLCIARRSCGSHMVVLFFGFLGDHVSRKMGNTHGPLTSPRPLFSQFVGSPRLTVPLLQWLVFKSPDDVTKPGWTHKGATKSDKDPNSICCMTRAKLRRDAFSQFPRFLIRNSVVISRTETERKDRKKERKAHCTWGTIRKAAPIEDWSRLLYEVYISATEGAHTACFVPKGWPTQKIHTNAAANWRAHISTQKRSVTHHGLHKSSSDNRNDLQLSHIYKTAEEKPPTDPEWMPLE